MDNLIKIICCKKTSLKEKTDAYITIVQILSKDKNALENSVTANYGPNLLNSIKNHIDSKSERSKEISIAALKALGCYLAMPTDLLQKLHGDDIFSDIIQCLCRLLHSEKEKQFYITGFWCLANQNIPKSIIAKHVKEIILCFQYHSSKNPSGTIMVEGLNVIKKLGETCPEELEVEIDTCLDSIFKELGSTHLFRAAACVMISCTQVFSKRKSIRNYIQANLNLELCTKINKHHDENASRIQLIKLWTCVCSLMGEEFFQLDFQVRNSMFKVMTGLFRHKSPEVQISLYNLWMALIDCVVSIPDEIEKREQIILQPMQLYHYYENSNVAEKCLKTYWYLICCINSKINENMEKFVLPILEMFLKDRDEGSEKGTPVSIPTTSKGTKAKSSSPSLKSMSIEMFCILFTHPDKRGEIKDSALHPFRGPKISSKNIMKCSDRFVNLLLKAATSMTSMTVRLWVSFLTDALEFLPVQSPEAKHMWSRIFLALKIIIDEKRGNIDFIFKVFPLIPVSQAFKELMSEKNKMGLPAFFIVQSLLDPFFVEKDIFENEKFFILYERMLEVLFNCTTGQLSVTLDIFDCIDNVHRLINDGIRWRLWSTLCHVFINFVNLTNEVNEGTSTDFNFDSVLKCLLYPLECINWAKLKDGEKNTLKDTWSELYKTYSRAVSLLPGFQDNLVIRILCQTIAEHTNKVDLKTYDLLISMLGVIIKSEDRKVLPENSLLHIGRVKHETCIGNVTYFLVSLKSLLTKMVNENQGQISRGSDMHLFKLIELVGFFFQKLNRYAELYESISALSNVLQLLFEKSNSKLINHLVKLLDSILSAFEDASDVFYDSNLLSLLEPFIIKSLACKQKPSNTRVIKFWNQTFGKNNPLICSEPLKKSLINCNSNIKALLNENSSVIQEVDEVAQFPSYEINSKSFDAFPKKFGSFLPVIKEGNTSPMKLASVCSPLSTKRYSRRKSKVKDDFVEIKDTPKKSKLLTEHQKEVMREKKNIPLMYNSLDHSQDTLLFHSYTQDLGNSQSSDALILPRKEEVIEDCNISKVGFKDQPPILISIEKMSHQDLKDQAKENVEQVNGLSVTDVKTSNKVCNENKSCETAILKLSVEHNDEEDSFIPSSQTRESFSQLRSPHTEGNQKTKIIEESPKENFLKNASNYTSLLIKDNDGNCEEADKIAVKIVSESNKENTISSWLSPKESIPPSCHTHIKLDIEDDIAIKLDNDNSSRRRKRKQRNNEIGIRKKRTKSLGSQIEDNNLICSNVKVKLELNDFDDFKRALPAAKRERRRKSTCGIVSQSSDIHNYLESSKKSKTEIKVEDVFLPTNDQKVTKKTEDIISILSLSPVKDPNLAEEAGDGYCVECPTNELIDTGAVVSEAKDDEKDNNSKSSIVESSIVESPIVESSAENCLTEACPILNNDKINLTISSSNHVLEALNPLSLKNTVLTVRNVESKNAITPNPSEKGSDDVENDVKQVCKNSDIGDITDDNRNTTDRKNSENQNSPSIELKNPFQSNVHNGSKFSELSPISKGPSAFASPSGILKKKIVDQSPSPPFKNRRVSFQLPESFSSEKTDEEKEKFALLLNKGRKNKSKSAQACIYPELKDCLVPIEKILPSLTFSRGVGHLVRAQNILTIGDLSSLSEAQVENLPIRSPKIRTVKNVLNTFSTQQSRSKGTPCKSPLTLDFKASGFVSPMKTEMMKSNDTSLNATPSKHSEHFRPTTLFSTTPPKEEIENSLSNKKKVEDKEIKSLAEEISDNVNFAIENDENKTVDNSDILFSEGPSQIGRNDEFDGIQSTPEQAIDKNEEDSCRTSNILSKAECLSENLIVEDAGFSLNGTPVKEILEKQSPEKVITGICMHNISPIKANLSEEKELNEEDEEIQTIDNKIHYSKENDTVTLKENDKVQNVDDFNSSDCVDNIDHMEGITPMNVSNTSIENVCCQNSLKEIEKSYEFSTKNSDNGEKTIMLLRSIDISKLSSSDIFDLVDEIDKFKSEAMSELKTRMFNHDTET